MDNEQQQQQQQPQKVPFLVGVSGGSAAGKKAVCQMIMDRLAEKSGCIEKDASDVLKSRDVAFLSLEDFYRELTEEEKQAADSGTFNFDHPDAFDWRLLETTLTELRKGNAVSLPHFDFETHTRVHNFHRDRTVQPDVVLFEGILALYAKGVRDALDMKVFVDVDSDTRLARRVLRDTDDRFHYTLDHVLTHYMRYVKPSYDDFIEPSKKRADVIIPRGPSNTVAVRILADHIHEILVKRLTTSESGTVVNRPRVETLDEIDKVLETSGNVYRPLVK